MILETAICEGHNFNRDGLSPKEWVATVEKQYLTPLFHYSLLLILTYQLVKSAVMGQRRVHLFLEPDGLPVETAWAWMYPGEEITLPKDIQTRLLLAAVSAVMVSFPGHFKIEITREGTSTWTSLVPTQTQNPVGL